MSGPRRLVRRLTNPRRLYVCSHDDPVLPPARTRRNGGLRRNAVEEGRGINGHDWIRSLGVIEHRLLEPAYTADEDITASVLAHFARCSIDNAEKVLDGLVAKKSHQRGGQR